MPIIKSAKKRVRVAHKAAARNVRTKRTIKASVKTFSAKTTAENLSKAQSAIDTAVKKGLIHKNKAARKKQQLAAQAKAAGVKLSKKSAKPATKKIAAKPATKKAVAKKPAVKKAPAKKPASKKTTKN